MQETLFDVAPMLEARDVSGNVVDLVAEEQAVALVPGNMRTVVTQHYTTDASSSAIATLALRERRWSGVPFSPPVVVTHIDGEP